MAIYYKFTASLCRDADRDPHVPARVPVASADVLYFIISRCCFDPDESDHFFIFLEFKSARHEVPMTLNRWRCTRLRFEDYKAQSGDGGNTWTVFIDQVPSIFVFLRLQRLVDGLDSRAAGRRKS